MTDVTAAVVHRPKAFLQKYPLPGGMNKLYALINAGTIQALKDGRSTLIPDCEGQKYLASLPGWRPAISPPKRKPTA